MERQCQAAYANGSPCARTARTTVETVNKGSFNLCAVHHTRLDRKGGVMLPGGSSLVHMPAGLTWYSPEPERGTAS